MIETVGLTKRYGAHLALDDCTLQIRRGEIFGLLGPNGAGKSTLLRLLLGFLQPTSGDARIDGLNCFRRPVEVRRRTAYLPGDARLFRGMSGRAIMQFFCEMRGGDPQRFARLAERLQVETRRRVAFLSTGMRQKLALASVLAAPVELFVLDEPTANLDPTVRAETLQIVRQLRERGATIVFSSHVLSEIEAICDRVAILRDGRLVRLQDMRQLAETHWIRVQCDAPQQLTPPLSLQDSIQSRDCGRDVAEFVATGDIQPWLSWLAEQAPHRVRIEPVGLEAVYHEYHPRQAMVSLDP